MGYPVSTYDIRKKKRIKLFCISYSEREYTPLHSAVQLLHYPHRPIKQTNNRPNKIKSISRGFAVYLLCLKTWCWRPSGTRKYRIGLVLLSKPVLYHLGHKINSFFHQKKDSTPLSLLQYIHFCHYLYKNL